MHSNSNTVATNMQDVLPIIVRLCDPEELANCNDMTPTTLDYLSDYVDGVDRMPFQIRRVEMQPEAQQQPGQRF